MIEFSPLVVLLGAEPFTKIKHIVDNKEVLERVDKLSLHKEFSGVVEVIGESGKSVYIRINHLTVENLKKAFALHPKILHMSGHGVLDFNKD